MRRKGYIHPSAVIGDPAQHRSEKEYWAPFIHDTATIEAFSSIDAGTEKRTYVGEDVWIMKSVHVGHDCFVGAGTEVCPMTSIAGHVWIGEGVKIGMGAVIKQFVRVGDGARIGMGAVVTKSVPPGEVWAGNPARKLC